MYNQTSTARQEETRGRGGQTCRRPFEPSRSRISNCSLRGFREVLSMFLRGWRRDPTSDRHAGAGTSQKTNTHTWQNQCQQAGWCYDGILASTTITNPRLPRRPRRRLDNRQPLERTKDDERSSQWGRGFRFSKCKSRVNAGKTSTLVHTESTALHVKTPKTRRNERREKCEIDLNLQTRHMTTHLLGLWRRGAGAASAKLW